MQHRTEQIYDERVFPLMAQVIDICRTAGIPMFATFGMIDEAGLPMACTTCIPAQLTGEARDALDVALDEMRYGHQVLRRAVRAPA